MKNKNEELEDILYWRQHPEKFLEAQKLINEGADINYRDKDDGATMLHKACIDVDIDLLKFLIKNEANVNALNDYGDSPLYYLLNYGRRDVKIEMIRCLLKKGADVEKFKSDELVEEAQASISIEKKQTQDNFFESITVGNRFIS